MQQLFEHTARYSYSYETIERSFRIFKNSKHYSPKTKSTLIIKNATIMNSKQNAYNPKVRCIKRCRVTVVGNLVYFWGRYYVKFHQARSMTKSPKTRVTTLILQ